MGYKSIRSNKKLRAAARSQLRGMWGKIFIAAFIIATLICLPLGLASSFLSDYQTSLGSENDAWKNLLMSFAGKYLPGTGLETGLDSTRLAAIEPQPDDLDYPELDKFFSDPADSSVLAVLDSRGADSLLAEFFGDFADSSATGFDMGMLGSILGSIQGAGDADIGDIIRTVILPVILPHLQLIVVIIIAAFIAALLALLICSMMIGPFQLGFSGVCLNGVEGEKIAIMGIFGGFRNFLSAGMLSFYTTVLVTLWIVLPLIPLVVGAAVLYQNMGMLHVILWVVLWCFISIISGITRAAGYSMAFFIMYDSPGIKPLEALKTSRLTMKGSKWKFTKLMLGFTGWFLLAALPAVLMTLVLPDFESFTVGWLLFEILPIKGICLLLAVSYLMLTTANFYDDLKTLSRSKASYASRKSRNKFDAPAGSMQETGNFTAGSKFGS